MSVTIFSDIEEAIAREIRRITYHDGRTVSKTILKSTFDPLTGETVEVPVDPKFYDSSAEAHNIQYPHFFIKLQRSREDRFTGRVVPPYGKWCDSAVSSSPKAYEIITRGSDGNINTIGSTINTSLFKINSISSGDYIRLLNGNNQGTYIIDSVTASNTGPHTITISNTLKNNLPEFYFNSSSRNILFKESVDLNTIAVNDVFEDANNTTFTITNIDVDKNLITIDGSTTPDVSSGATITRVGSVFQQTDPSLVKFIIMDPTKPVTKLSAAGNFDQTGRIKKTNPQIPIDAYYLVRIDSKERENHRDVLNRVWEEFNPPRHALPTIKRSKLSVEQALKQDVATGGSTSIFVEDYSNYNIGDSVFIFDNLRPTKDLSGGFLTPFTSKIVDFGANGEITLADTVPDTYKTENNAKIVSNADYDLLMFHFVDHTTKDVESAQYWSHEFIFWVQLWIDKLEDEQEVGTVTDIDLSIYNLDDGDLLLD